MGPFASAVQVDAPLSPESDVTPPKEGLRKERVVVVVNQDGMGKKELRERNNLAKDTASDAMPVGFRRPPKTRSNDPRLAKSLDLEILEEEADEMRAQLEDERAKNKYLLGLTEDLKRQIREETGAWYPSILTPKRGGPSLSYKQIYDARKPLVTEHGMNPNAFRLPQLSYQNQKIQPIDQEPQLTPSHKQPRHHDRQHQNSQFQQQLKEGPTSDLSHNKNISKVYERNKSKSTALPAIVQTGESQQRRKSDGQVKLGGEVSNHSGMNEYSYSSRGKHHPKGKTKYRQHPSERLVPNQEGTEQYLQLSLDEQKPYRQQPYKEHRQQKSQHKSKNSEQEVQQQQPHPRPKHSDKQRSQEEARKSVVENSQSQNSRPKHRSGSSPRTRTPSRGRVSDTDRPTQEPSKANKSVASSSRNSKLNAQLNGVESSVPIENGNPKPTKHLNSKSSQGYPEDSSSSFDVLPTNGNMEGVMAGSSNSLGSLPSTSSRTKHRGRTNKRGGKKSKKDIHEPREEFKDP